MHHKVFYMGPNVNETDQNFADEYFYRSIHNNLHNYTFSLIKYLASSKSYVVGSPYNLTNHVWIFISVKAVPYTRGWWLCRLMCLALRRFVRGYWMQMESCPLNKPTPFADTSILKPPERPIMSKYLKLLWFFKLWYLSLANLEIGLLIVKWKQHFRHDAIV